MLCHGAGAWPKLTSVLAVVILVKKESVIQQKQFIVQGWKQSQAVRGCR